MSLVTPSPVRVCDCCKRPLDKAAEMRAEVCDGLAVHLTATAANVDAEACLPCVRRAVAAWLDSTAKHREKKPAQPAAK